MAAMALMPPLSPLSPPASNWQDGWYRPAHVLASPNFSQRPPGAQVDLVVVHSISLPPGEYGNGHIQQLFANQLDWSAHPYFESIRGLQVSAHFLIGREGGLWQFVSCDHSAWHAGQSSFDGRTRCNDYSVGIELEGLEGQRFGSNQYRRLGELCLALATRYPIRYIAGHEHIAPGRKHDPGPGFDWKRLQLALGSAAIDLPTQP